MSDFEYPIQIQGQFQFQCPSALFKDKTSRIFKHDILKFLLGSEAWWIKTYERSCSSPDLDVIF